MSLTEVRTTLPYEGPYDARAVLGHFVATATPGVEQWRAGTYRRTVGLAGGAAILALAIRPEHVGAVFRLTSVEDEAEAVSRCRRLLDLDAPMGEISASLSADPSLGPLVSAAPGQRIPGSIDAAEQIIKVIFGQQISTARAAALVGRIAEQYGEPINDPDGSLTHLFPTSAVIAGIDPATLPMPRRRAHTIVTVAGLLATGEIDLTTIAAAREQLAAVPGIGPWTVEVVAMRALGDPDAFPSGDLGVRKALATLPGADPERWRPWRSYATQQLWASLDHEMNRLV